MGYWILIIMFLAAFIAAPVYLIGQSMEKEAKCLRHERKTVRVGQWIQTIPMGKSTTTIVHPGHEEMRSVCVEYSE